MEDFDKIIQDIKIKNPLVYNITNLVVTNISANVLLALGASPIMSFSKHEALDLAKISSAVVINMGTPTDEVVETMISAGKKANKMNVPVIFDPVGVGASNYRNKIVNKIISEVKIDIIRGNASEIANLSGIKIQTKGVDSVMQVQNIKEIVRNLAEKLDCTVCASGQTDIISNGRLIYACQNGHILLTKITGSGCMLSALTGATASVCRNYVLAGLCACLIMGISAEKAAKKTTLPGSFMVELINSISGFEAKTFGLSRFN